MKKYAIITIIFIIVFTSISCQLIYGPDLPVSIKISHINSELIENNGIGEDWQNIFWKVDGIELDTGVEYTMFSSTWEELIITTHYEEYDETYTDIGENKYREEIYKIIKNSGTKFGLNIYNTIYEQRSANPTYSGTNAVFCDTFEIEIVYN